MKRFLLGILACGCLNQATAQVKFQLSLMADHRTYLVSMTPAETWAYPKNITGTAQVTVRIPANVRFTAGNITSLQAGVKWLDNARIEHPASDPTHDYVSFSLTTMATKNIPYQQGVETPLFTFMNLQNDCVGKVELIDNNETVVTKITAEGFNVKNHLSTLATKGGEAFTGIQGNRVADCSTTTAAQDLNKDLSILNAYPVPATDLLTIEWTNGAVESQNTVLIATDILGREVFTQKIGPLSRNIPTSSGIQGNLNKIDINVVEWVSGLYLFHFVNDKGISATQKVLVTK
jgi:Secretion system C-terminal sorting domain